MGQQQPFSIAVILTLDRLLQDADQPSVDPFLENADLNVSSDNKPSFAEVSGARLSSANSGRLLIIFEIESLPINSHLWKE